MARVSVTLPCLLLTLAATVAYSSPRHACPMQELSQSDQVDEAVCGSKSTVVIHDNVEEVGRRLRVQLAKTVDPLDNILPVCRHTPSDYIKTRCTPENKASWKARADAGILPNHPDAKCVTEQKPDDTTIIKCALGFQCDGHKAICSLVEEECNNWEYECGSCPKLQQVSCCNQCWMVEAASAGGKLTDNNTVIDHVKCFNETSCSFKTLRSIVHDNQDVCEHDPVTGEFTCEVSEVCQVGEPYPVKRDASWQCLATPCNECCTEECRAQCCNKCLEEVCGEDPDSEHKRKVCLGCDYYKSTPPRWDLPPYHKTTFKSASLLINEIETTDKFDPATCKKMVAPVPAKGVKLDEDEALCRLSAAEYTGGELCTDLLGKWKEICGLPIDGDACALGGDLQLSCTTDWGCKGGDVLCSLYEDRYDTLAFDCTKCSDPLRFKCCQECFEVMDKQEFDEKHKRGVTCGGCRREELATIKGTPFSPPGEIEVDAAAATVKCKYQDECKTGKVEEKVEDASWKCLVTPCDACGDNITAKALCCVECLSQTCSSNGKDPVRHVCTGCDELPQSTVTTTFILVGNGTPPPPKTKVVNVNVSTNMDMEICRSENTTNLTVEEVLGGKPPAGREEDIENCTSSPQLQCSNVGPLLETWKKNYNALRHDLRACSVNKLTGQIECVTERKCEGGHSYCFLAESGSASISYDCGAKDISELQRHSCCATCADAMAKAADDKLKDNEGHSYTSVTCKGCTRDDLSGIADTSCAAAAEDDHCIIKKQNGDFTCAFHEDYATGTKTLHTEDLSWQCTVTPCDVCSAAEETDAANDRLRSQCCFNCLTAASKTCSNNRTRNICQGCQEEEAGRVYETTKKNKGITQAYSNFVGLLKASPTFAVAGFAGLLTFATAMIVAVARRLPGAGARSEIGVQDPARGEYSIASFGGTVE